MSTLLVKEIRLRTSRRKSEPGGLLEESCSAKI